MGRGLAEVPEPFTYPLEPHMRKHGPFGYSEYESYREWLRDEFTFRCVFCLRREQWDSVFEIDHLVPQCIYVEGRCIYENLVYSCKRCNSTKKERLIHDPCQVGYGQCLEVDEKGVIRALNKYGRSLIRDLRLDSRKNTLFRRQMIQMLRSLAKANYQEFIVWMGYPDDLCDLGKLKPPGNTKPEGVHDCFYARRERGELEEVY